MNSSQKTTVYLKAVSDYARRHARRQRPKSVGAFRSGRKDLSERAEDFLAGLGR